MSPTIKELYDDRQYKAILDFLNPTLQKDGAIQKSYSLFYIWSLYRYYLEKEQWKTLVPEKVELVIYEIERFATESEVMRLKLESLRKDREAEHNIDKKINSYVSTKPKASVYSKKKNWSKGYKNRYSSKKSKVIVSRSIPSIYSRGINYNENAIYRYEYPKRDYDDSTAFEQGNYPYKINDND